MIKFFKKLLSKKRKEIPVVEDKSSLKRRFRWIAEIPEISNFVIASASRPTASFSSFGVVWEPIYITTYDPIEPSTARAIWDLSMDIKIFDFSLKLLDHEGTVIEKWEFKDAYFLSVDYGSLDYADNSAIKISARIKYSEAKLVF